MVRRFVVPVTLIAMLIGFVVVQSPVHAQAGASSSATVIAPASDLLKASHIGVRTAELAVLLALASNGVLKLVLAAVAGTRAFTLRITLAYVVWVVAAGVGLSLQ